MLLRERKGFRGQTFLSVKSIVVNGLINISISTIEKRYELNSSLTGLISASYDIAFCVLSLFVSFFGERGHKPRWLAFSAFMLGLGSLVFSLPHFSSGKYHYGAKLEDTCQISGASSANFTCSASTKSSLSNYLYVFILGQLLLGVGGTPLYTLGTAFIDDSVPKHTSSLYIGIGYAMSLLGPAIGYVLGGQLLSIYIDIKIPESTQMDQDDPRWLGAWWIGFLACFFAMWFLIIPFSCFPKYLPGTAKIQAEKISETHNDGSEALVEAKNIGKNFRDFPIALLILLKNPVLMSLILASTSEALVATGFATFLPKFIENQFGMTSSFSATLGGLVLVPAAALGQVISGILVSKYKMDCKNMIKFMIGTCSVAFLLNTVFLVAKCGNEPFAGVSETYNGTGMLHNLTAPCNANCRCSSSRYYPVCGRDEVQYFSPCFAGCASYNLNNKKKTYYNCSCIGKLKRENISEDFLSEAVPGKCPTRCKHLPLFLIYFFFAVVFTFMAVTPTTVAVLRCVPDKQRSFALGVQSVFLRLLGTVPGPILFGFAIDNSCSLWDVNECRTKGACWVYDNERMAYLLMSISAACKIITIIFVVVAVFLYKPPQPRPALPQKDSEMVSAIHA
ncbi:solute carrier organic anion transporter family member 4C1 isoform X2 [Gallus gallus]|uniref:solute carrier organic anion transporter family member 4C1 isoform X2 n=1 Tax=Gallus gallus TaxID=9031 RepID=UPI0003504298|nr:solute carrier organic anion transporter family member 4C1 isoform X2 [Gallus gallus]XP_046791943.1 solute carrier organic anion transporter family member 4C1 isoform X2 [Gallus gallus]|eukprot:XP_004949364.1 solute carrier organic anion transporter family member 4C1 isoform X2 [Gallus gallus]